MNLVKEEEWRESTYIPWAQTTRWEEFVEQVRFSLAWKSEEIMNDEVRKNEKWWIGVCKWGKCTSLHCSSRATVPSPVWKGRGGVVLKMMDDGTRLTKWLIMFIPKMHIEMTDRWFFYSETCRLSNKGDKNVWIITVAIQRNNSHILAIESRSQRPSVM